MINRHWIVALIIAAGFGLAHADAQIIQCTPGLVQQNPELAAKCKRPALQEIAATHPAPAAAAQARPIGAAVHDEAIVTGEQGDLIFDGKKTAAKTDDERDPLVKYNEPVFKFNKKADDYVLKPIAKGYKAVLRPTGIEVVGNVIDNIGFVPRTANSLMQGKVLQAGKQVASFVIDTTLGVAGLWDPAKKLFHIERADATFGQTLGKAGVPAGPYFVPPLLPSTTIRDGAGQIVDLVLDPVNWVAPLIGSVSEKVVKTINDRAANLDTFQSIENDSVDLYGAVRGAVLQQADNEVKK